MGNARTQAIANENAAIEASQSRAIAARETEQQRPRNALEAMAQRLHVTPDVLRTTLQKTAFSTCRTNEEFVSMVIVANEYGLNPMLKEIYAFPGKGGGIMPMVGVDGWIRLMNEHSAFDGIEFDYIADQKGGIEAIEAVIWRKDRAHPIKVIEYMEECRRGTDPWKTAPRRMLRHRALIQCVRIAFGFSGIAAEGDEDEFANVPIHDIEPVRQPTRQSLAEELDDEIPNFDKQTGEVIEGTEQSRPDDGDQGEQTKGFTDVSEEEARKLDAGEDASDEQGQAEAAEQTVKDIDAPLEEGESESQGSEDLPMWKQQCIDIDKRLKDATTLKDVNATEKDWLNKVRGGVPDGEPVTNYIEKAIVAAKKRVKGED